MLMVLRFCVRSNAAARRGCQQQLIHLVHGKTKSSSLFVCLLPHKFIHHLRKPIQLIWWWTPINVNAISIDAMQQHIALLTPEYVCPTVLLSHFLLHTLRHQAEPWRNESCKNGSTCNQQFNCEIVDCDLQWSCKKCGYIFSVWVRGCFDDAFLSWHWKPSQYEPRGTFWIW